MEEENEIENESEKEKEQEMSDEMKEMIAKRENQNKQAVIVVNN